MLPSVRFEFIFLNLSLSFIFYFISFNPLQTLKNLQNCKPWVNCVNFFILPAVSCVKARKRLVQEKYIEFSCFSRSDPFCITWFSGNIKLLFKWLLIQFCVKMNQRKGEHLKITMFSRVHFSQELFIIYFLLKLKI